MCGNQNECRVGKGYMIQPVADRSPWQLGDLGHLPAAVVVGAYRVGPAMGPPSAWTEAG
jgi:hypothetical protein